MPDPTERWLPIPGYEDFYEVSDLGRIRSVRILRPFPDSDGYLRVNLSRNGHIDRLQAVHRLVLLAFDGPQPPGMQCRHGPGGKLDNRPVNLSWGTPLENSGDKRRDGTMAHGETQGSAKLTWVTVEEIRRRAAAGETQVNLAEFFGVSNTTIWRIVHRRTWR